jgi:hypothetical protein
MRIKIRGVGALDRPRGIGLADAEDHPNSNRDRNRKIMEQDVQKIEMQDEFRVCPACGYQDGFHSLFRRQGKGIRWLLICPSCHKLFDIGLTASMEQI